MTMQVNDKSNKDQSLYSSEQKDEIASTDFTNTIFYSSTMQSGVDNDLLNRQILLAIQTPDLAEQVKGMLTQHNVKVFADFSNLSTTIEYIHTIHPCLLILESSCNNSDTLELALRVRLEDRRFPIILVTTNGSEALAISALRYGLKDYFTHPFLPHEFNAAVNRCIANYRFQPAGIKTQSLAPRISSEQQFIGESFLMYKVKAYLQKLALVGSHVLITGETGTGKELTAQYIHQHSARYSKPFMAINCAAIPDGLLESELFGYEKGAFTGANSAYAGKLKLTDGGTVFFDEIGDMSSYAQAKILRVIESREVYPLGAKRSVPLDIRVIAATNCDLENMVLKKYFRQDLYFRLNVARVQLPPLRDRKEDIECLVKHYLQVFNALFKREISGFTEDAWELLLNHDWPGNIRELKNFLEVIYIDPPSNHQITIKDLPDLIGSSHQQEDSATSAERDLLFSTLCSVHWNKSKAAEKLHWSRMTLYRKMAKYHITDS
jgi:DNA-binding NtrC family response regulator